MSNSSLKPYLGAVLTVVLWGSAYIGIRVGLQDGYSPGAMALFRYLIASFCLLLIYWRLGFRRLSMRDIALSALLGFTGFTIYNLALNIGELTVNAGMSAFIIAQTPVLITLMAVAFFGDRLTPLGWAGTVLSVLGILFIATSDHQGWHLKIGVLYLLVAALSGSLFSILQKPLLKRLHPIECTTLSVWFGTLGLIGYFPQLIHEMPHASLSATIFVIYNGIFPAAIAYLIWSYVLTKTPMSRAAILLYFVPIAATLMGFLFLREGVSLLEISGGLLTLLGAFLVNRNVYSTIGPPIKTE